MAGVDPFDEIDKLYPVQPIATDIKSVSQAHEARRIQNRSVEVAPSPAVQQPLAEDPFDVLDAEMPVASKIAPPQLLTPAQSSADVPLTDPDQITFDRDMAEFNRTREPDILDGEKSFFETLGTNYKNAVLDVFEQQIRNLSKEYTDTGDFKYGGTGTFVPRTIAGLYYHGSRLVDEKAASQTSEEFGAEMEAASKARQERRRVEGMPNKDSLSSDVAASTGSSLGMMTGALGLGGFRNVPAMLTSTYYLIAAQSENQALDEGNSSLRAGLYGQIQGMIEAAGSFLPTKFLFKGGVGGGMFSPVAKKLGGFIARELPSEMATTLMQDIATKAIIHWEQPIEEFWADLKKDLVLTLFSTPLSAGAQVASINAASAGYNKAQDAYNTYKTNVAAAQQAGVVTEAQAQQQTQIDTFLQQVVKESGEAAAEGKTVAYHGTEAAAPSFNKTYVTKQSSGDVWGIQLSSDAARAVGNVQTTRRRAKTAATGPAKVLPVTIPNDMPLLRAEEALRDQPIEVKVILENNKVNVDTGLTGLDYYKNLVKSTGSAQKASKYLDSLGIKGMQFGKPIKTEAGMVGVTNYSIFNPTNTVPIQLDAKNIEITASAAKLAGVKESIKELMTNPPEVSFKQKIDALQAAILHPSAAVRESKYSPDIKEYIRQTKEDNVKLNWLIKQTAGLETYYKLYKNVPGMESFYQNIAGVASLHPVTREVVREEGWWATKSRWTDYASQTAKDWHKAVRSPAIATQMDELMDKADRASERLGRRLTTAELQQIVKDNNLTLLKKEHLGLANRVWEDYRKAFVAVKEQVIENAKWTISDPNRLAERIKEINDAFKIIENSNYLPRTNFGQFTIEYTAPEDMTYKGREYIEGDTVWYSTHRTTDERNKQLDKLAKEFNTDKEDFVLSKLKDSERMWQGIPDSFLDQLVEKLELDPDQQAELEVMRQKVSKESASMRRHTTRRVSEGYSTDSLRSYSDFFGRFSNHIARLTHDRKLLAALETMEANTQPDMTSRVELAQEMREIRKYLNEPGNELAAWRAFGFTWYLGANVKSAVINTFQIPIVALPYLSKEYEESSATKALLEAIADHSRFWQKGKRYTNGEMDMIERLRGLVLNESQATELGSVAAGSYLERIVGLKTQGYKSMTSRSAQWTAHKLSWMFQQTEVANRHIVALAAYNLSMKKNGKDGHEIAINDALRAVRETQFDYARWNRPKLFRGKKSVLFLFMNYPASMMWFIGTDPAKWRMLFMMFAAAGLSGLPFAENIMDLVDFLATKSKQLAGYSDPKTQVRRDLRDYFVGLFEDPPQDMQNFTDKQNTRPQDFAQLIMHGLAGSAFNVDVSGSLSMGRILPGTDTLSQENRADTAVSQSIKRIAGAVGAIPLAIMEAAMSDSTDKWKTWEKALPASARNLSRSSRWAIQKEEINSSKEPIAYFDYETDWPLLLKQGMGFPPAEMTKKQQQEWEMRDAINFYKAYRTTTLSQMYDIYNGDDAGKMTQIREIALHFNNIVPYPEMKITSDTIKQSITGRLRGERYAELGIEEERIYRGMRERINPELQKPLRFGQQTP